MLIQNQVTVAAETPWRMCFLRDEKDGADGSVNGVVVYL
jgi:hypothetical protein